MNQELKRLKKEIKDTEEKWEVANKKFEEVDRKIAFATKVRVIERKKPEDKMTAAQAIELLALLGVTNLEEVDDGTDVDSEVELSEEALG